MLAINEATLEMHFHVALMDLFRSTYGLGPTGSIEFFKYSPQLERFVGFDQAYVRTELSEDELYRELREAAMNTGYVLSRRLYGYFLQFKVVNQMQRRSRGIPSGFSAPYLRVALSTNRKRTNHPSQHELLYGLAQNSGSMVYYACPMVFDRTDLYRPEPDLDHLVLADVASCPSSFDDNEHHTLCFQEEASPPTWCSDPAEGERWTPVQFIEQLVENVKSDEKIRGNSKVMLSFLESSEFVDDWKGWEILSLIGDPLTFVSVINDAA